LTSSCQWVSQYGLRKVTTHAEAGFQMQASWGRVMAIVRLVRGERIGADAGIEIEIGIDNQTLQTHAKRIETMRFTCFQLLWTAIGYMGWRMRRGRAECHIITMRKRSGPAKTPRAPGGANGFRVMTAMSSWSAGVCLVSQAEKFVVLISNA